VAQVTPPGAEAPPSEPARPTSSTTTLAEEGRLLAKAHQLVQAGQGQEALEVLRTSAARFPKSVLYQEREVLTIEALGATGAFGAAKARAERFLKRYPKSPHSGRLQRFVE
jgi:outer membrane protein assembly factor BamD (BamD/ComL family)